MSWRTPQLPVEPDDRLDPLRDAVAAMRLDGQTVGYLVTKVGPGWEQVSGHLWWTRWEPREYVEWEMTRVDEDAPLPEFADGLNDSEDVVEEFLSGRFVMTDHRPDSGPWEDRRDFTYVLEWLEGDEHDRAWTRFGFA